MVQWFNGSMEKANHSSKKKPNGKKERKGKTFQKLKSLKPKVKILINFCACLGQNVILVARTVSCRVAKAFPTRLRLIWPRSSL